MKIRIKVSMKQIPSYLVAIVRHAQSTQINKSLRYFSNISRKKKGRCEVDFCTFINKSFYKLILSILVNMAILTQSTQIIKFAKTFQYFKKEVRDKVDFCTDKH